MFIKTGVMYRAVVDGEDMGVRFSWTGCARMGEDGMEFLMKTDGGDDVIVTSFMLSDLVEEVQ